MRLCSDISNLPEIIVAADWSTDPGKRIACRAVLRKDFYEVSEPEAVGDACQFLERVRSFSQGQGAVLIGFDFPIGLPDVYSKAVGIADFRTALKRFGEKEWGTFYQVSNHPSRYQPFYPISATKKGQVSRDVLLNALRVHEWADLLRQCERGTDNRNAACCLFWTLGGNQVGRAACHGWKHVLVPALDKIKMWPFDGSLKDLLSAGGTVVAEIYPAEACAQMGIRFGGGTGLSKRRVEDRSLTVKSIRNWMSGRSIECDKRASRALEAGFASDDHYDAFVGVLGMISAVTQDPQSLEPDAGLIRDVEGWILGVEVSPTPISFAPRNP